MSTGRGRWAENKVRDYFKKRKDLVFYRFPDTLAGYLQPTPCDFMAVKGGMPVLLEVKETKHTHLLPYKNVPADQIARMRLWAWQGCKIYVVMAFRGNKGKKVWTWEHAEYFVDRPTEPKPGQTRKVGSWDFTEWPLATIEDILGELV